ncbi:hypothetical protein PtB15_6B309 [Puccinia triticina]|nr:hypothetical protein PtB15_6B309 [Puccinia triticina]
MALTAPITTRRWTAAELGLESEYPQQGLLHEFGQPSQSFSAWNPHSSLLQDGLPDPQAVPGKNKRKYDHLKCSSSESFSTLNPQSRHEGQSNADELQMVHTEANQGQISNFFNFDPSQNLNFFTPEFGSKMDSPASNIVQDTTYLASITEINVQHKQPSAALTKNLPPPTCLGSDGRIREPLLKEFFTSFQAQLGMAKEDDGFNNNKFSYSSCIATAPREMKSCLVTLYKNAHEPKIVEVAYHNGTPAAHPLPLLPRLPPQPTASTASSSTSPSLTIESNLEESIFGIAPFNDFTWTIAQFIWQHSREYWLRGEAHLVEVEAKLGTIRDRSKQSERIEYPIATESPILNTAHTKFQSDMPPSHHANLNRLLNQRVTETNAPGYCGAKVDYLHLKQVDEFHQGKVRVSRDSSGNKSPPRSIIKEKLAHLDIHCPGRSFDFRISVNIEHPVPLPPEHSTPTFRRIKDRLSYSHQITQIDLTQVKSTDQNASTSTHEVEVEFKDSTELLRAASIWASEREEGEGGASRNGDRPEDDQRPSSARRLSRSQHQLLDAQEYLLMVDVLLNNVRMLIRNC